MDEKFEEMFEEKFGGTFSSKSMEFVNKAMMYEGWRLYQEFAETLLADIMKEQTKGE